MNENNIFFYGLIFVILFVISGLLSGCASRPVFTGAEDIGRLRGELESLRAEHDRLLDDYQRLIGENQRYAGYYQSATAAIADGLGKLQSAGSGMANEIQRLRANNQLLIGIIQRLADAERAAGDGNSYPAGESFEDDNRDSNNGGTAAGIAGS